jgi:hypothetical protein
MLQGVVLQIGGWASSSHLLTLKTGFVTKLLHVCLAWTETLVRPKHGTET